MKSQKEIPSLRGMNPTKQILKKIGFTSPLI